ncbi:MAG: hypothetical protein SFU99_03655 [Saprospiraceae bacterium]|nr:hypothetical protein [Saprospiraceae bacterium]
MSLKEKEIKGLESEAETKLKLINRLRKTRAYENDAATTFKLDNQIEEAENELEQIKRRIEQVKEGKIEVGGSRNNRHLKLLFWIIVGVLISGSVSWGIFNGFLFGNSNNLKLYNFNLQLDDKVPNILILPFNQYGKSPEDIGKIIHRRLNIKKEEDDLLANFIYCDDCIDRIGENFNRDSAQYIINKYGLDLIVYGDQLAENCSLSGKDEVCVNYLTSPNHQSFLRENSQDFSKNSSPITIPEILDGKLQGKVDYVVLFLSSILYKNVGEPQKALENYNYISDTLGVKNEEVVSEMVFLNLGMQDSSSALRAIEKYRDSKTLPTIEDWLLIYALKIAVYSRMEDIQNFESTLSESDIVLSISQLPKNNRTITNFRRMGEFIAPYKPDYAMNFIDDALKYSIELDIQDEIPKCYHELGRIHLFKKSYNQAIKMLDKALALYDKNNLTHIWLIIKARQLLGASYIGNKQKQKGIKEFKKAIKLIEKTHVSEQLVITYSWLADELFKIEKFSEAISYQKKAMNICQSLPESREKITLSVFLYFEAGNLYGKTGNFKEGVRWLEKSIQASKALRGNYGETCLLISNAYVALIENLEKLQEIDRSKIYKAEMLEFSKYCKLSN